MGARQSQVLVWEKNVPSPQRIVSSFHGKECISIAVGGGHYAAVVSTGEIYTWGVNRNGQLGYKTTDEPNIPRIVSSSFGKSIKIISVSCGEAHTAALTENGILYTWGCPQNGRLGRNGRHDRPGKVQSLSTIPILDVSCGGYHTVALTRSGLAYTWGLGAEGRLGIGNDLDQSAPLEVEFHDNGFFNSSNNNKRNANNNNSNDSNNSSNSINNNNNNNNNIGSNNMNNNNNNNNNNSNKHNTHANHLINSHDNNNSNNNANDNNDNTTNNRNSYISPPAKEISAGGHHTLAIVTGKLGMPPSVYSWGGGSFGKLGHGNEKSQSRPLPISFFSSLGEGDYVVHIAAGGQHSAAVLSSGDVYTWGQSAQGRLGHSNINGNVLSPRRVIGMDSACRIKCGEQHTCVITEIAELYVCGLRHESAKIKKTFTKVTFTEKSTAVENIDAGEGRTIILARQDRHAVMKILDRDHHGPFPVTPHKAQYNNNNNNNNNNTSNGINNNGLFQSPSSSDKNIGDTLLNNNLKLLIESNATKHDDINLVDKTAENELLQNIVIKNNRTNIELISTLSARIQDLETTNEKLESNLKRAKARNAILESMLRRALNPVVEAISSSDTDIMDDNVVKETSMIIEGNGES